MRCLSAGEGGGGDGGGGDDGDGGSGDDGGGGGVDGDGGGGDIKLTKSQRKKLNAKKKKRQSQG